MNPEQSRSAFEQLKKNKSLLGLVEFVDGEYTAKNVGTWHDQSRSQNAAKSLNNDYAVWQAALAAQVPSGYVVVPRSPTPEMVTAVNQVYKYPMGPIDVYRAMISVCQ